MEVAPLPASFYARDTELVARELLGCFLVSSAGGSVTGGRIVEVEAYVGPHDPADHGYGNRRTTRNAALFGPPGTAYVYFIYGMHWCFNAVTEREGYPAAVLIRALEPVWGIDQMRRRRKTQDTRLLCSGPGRLCQALGIDGGLNGLPLDREPLRILPGDGPVRRVKVSGRVGVSRAADWPLRFSLEGSLYLSRPAG
ncbi:MAG: putative 3-methyladenine DNA glycosylase [Gemmatimonadales bacterium]|nr:MAG: putative 3-methyladenine DNA glycosylase [Gemmatimonadales bacterium]